MKDVCGQWKLLGFWDSRFLVLGCRCRTFFKKNLLKSQWWLLYIQKPHNNWESSRCLPPPAKYKHFAQPTSLGCLLLPPNQLTGCLLSKCGVRGHCDEFRIDLSASAGSVAGSPTHSSLSRSIALCLCGGCRSLSSFLLTASLHVLYSREIQVVPGIRR